MLFLSFWTKLCLIRVWLCYVIGLCSFNVWSVSIDKDCLEVVKHILIIQHDSSVLDQNDNTFVFLDESFLEIETNIWYAPCTRKSNFMSRTSASFFFLYFPILLFSAKLTFTENSSFLAFSPFFRCGFTRFRVFLLLQRRRKQTIKQNVWESNDGDQNNEKRVPFVMSTQTELLFFSITKCAGKDRNRPKILHRKSGPIIIAMITSED